MDQEARTIRSGPGWCMKAYDRPDDTGYLGWVETDAGDVICWIDIEGKAVFVKDE